MKTNFVIDPISKYLLSSVLSILFLSSCAGRSLTAKSIQPIPIEPVFNIESIDANVDPCVDFYQYSCGNWLKNNPVPADKSRWYSYYKTQREVDQSIRLWIEKAAQAPENEDEKKVGDYFAACIDESALDQKDLQPIQNTWKQIDSLQSTKEKDFARFLALQHMRGTSFLFAFGVEDTTQGEKRKIAYVSQAGSQLPDVTYYTDAKEEKTRSEYLKYIATILTLAGVDSKQISHQVQTIWAFEKIIAAASLNRTQRREPANTVNVVSIGRLKSITPSFDWNTYFDEYFKETRVQHRTQLTTINMWPEKLFQTIENLLTTQSIEDWKLFLRFRLLSSKAPFLSKHFRDADFKFFSQTLKGIKKRPEPWEGCIDRVKIHLSDAISQMFIKHFPHLQETKLAMSEMLKHFREVTLIDIQNLNWMTPTTKEKAISKLNNMFEQVAHPEEWINYSSVNVQREDWYGTQERTFEFNEKREISKLGQHTNRKEWTTLLPPTEVTAYFTQELNMMTFPAAVLLPRYFDVNDLAASYGNTGQTVGHELIHGFDDKGSKYDANGNLVNWWTPQDRIQFDERTQCVAQQYAHYNAATEVDGASIKVNGQLTLGENVADLGGAILAYYAWKRATQENDIPHNGFTGSQRFFIGNAQWACMNETEEAARNAAKTDPHAPYRYRVNGLIANMPEFLDAFPQCKGKGTVHESARSLCTIWGDGIRSVMGTQK